MPSLIEPLQFSNPKVTAAGLAYGGKLGSVTLGDDGRLVFTLTDLPPDFLKRIANDEIVVSAKAFISAMETILSLVSENQRGRRGGRS